MGALRRASLAGLSLVFAAGCDGEFKPETLVEDFRVLAMTIEPPELHPGETATLRALVVDPSRRQKNSVVWLSCDPDPFNLGRSACTNSSDVFDTAVLTSPEGKTPELPPPGMRIAGFNEQASYTVAADIFSVLPPDDLRRRSGTLANILALAVGDDVSPVAPQAEFDALFLRIQRKEVRSLLVLSRIRVTEEPRLNKNPLLSELRVDGVTNPEGAKLRILPAAQVKLELVAPDESFESYQQLDAEGQLADKTETLVAAWYSNFGSFSDPRITLRSDKTEIYTAPGGSHDPLPEKTSGMFYAVLRDTRGGQSWFEYPMFLCDPSLPAPSVAKVDLTVNPSLVLMTVSGVNIDQVADVVIGGKALVGGQYSTDRKVFEGVVPKLAAGEYPITVRARNCGDVETGKTYVAP